MANFGGLSDAEGEAVGSIIARLIKMLLGLWSGVDRWDEESVIPTVIESIDLVEAAQLEVRRQVYAYSQQTYKAVDADSFDDSVLGLEDPTYPRWDVTPLTVWNRPLQVYQRELATGASKEEAKTAALERVQSLAESEVKLAKRDQEARINLASEKAVGYRRIIHPELSKTGVCGTCIVAASRIYEKGDLLPIHNGCNCTVLPVTKSADPGLKLNQDDLDNLYGAAGSTSRKQLSNIRVREFVSGELGPILTKDGKEVEESAEERKYKAAPDDVDRKAQPKDIQERIETLQASFESYESQARKFRFKNKHVYEMSMRKAREALEQKRRLEERLAKV